MSGDIDPSWWRYRKHYCEFSPPISPHNATATSKDKLITELLSSIIYSVVMVGEGEVLRTNDLQACFNFVRMNGCEGFFIWDIENNKAVRHEKELS